MWGLLKMSNSVGLVKFPNDRVMFYEYSGCTDIAKPILYDTLTELLHNWRKPQEVNPCTHEGVEVEIYSSYGEGFYWTGKACSTCCLITDKRMPFEEEEGFIIIDGKPSWAVKVLEE
jgi:hypothetical protein